MFSQTQDSSRFISQLRPGSTLIIESVEHCAQISSDNSSLYFNVTVMCKYVNGIVMDIIQAKNLNTECLFTVSPDISPAYMSRENIDFMILTKNQIMLN